MKIPQNCNLLMDIFNKIQGTNKIRFACITIMIIYLIKKTQ